MTVVLNDSFRRGVVSQLAAAGKKKRSSRCAECGEAIVDGELEFRCLNVAGAMVHARCFEEHQSACKCYGPGLGQCHGGGVCGGSTVGPAVGLAAGDKKKRARCTECGKEFKLGDHEFRCLAAPDDWAHSSCFEEHLKSCGCFATALGQCHGGGVCGG